MRGAYSSHNHRTEVMLDSPGSLDSTPIDDQDNWLLVDKITGSPVRVVTKDPLLTTAFWTEDWSAGDSDLPARASLGEPGAPKARRPGQ